MQRVLIVEDVPEMLEMLKTMLESSPAKPQVLTASSAMEARAVALRARPDIVFLDEVLPGESSVDLAHELVSDGIKVVFITGMDERPISPAQALPELKRITKPSWRNLKAGAKAFYNELNQ